jgi:hypothetical protein
LLVAASAVSSNGIPMCDSNDKPENVKAVCQLCIALLRAMEGMVEKGLVLLSATSPASPAERGYAAAAHQKLAVPLPKPPAPRQRELPHALEKADER